MGLNAQPNLVGEPGLFFIISTVTAAVGYLVASFTWNWWVRHKRRAKLEQLMAGRETK